MTRLRYLDLDRYLDPDDVACGSTPMAVIEDAAWAVSETIFAGRRHERGASKE
jgi:hypothetical protein